MCNERLHFRIAGAGINIAVKHRFGCFAAGIDDPGLHPGIAAADGKLTTFYHQIPREQAEEGNVWPHFAMCVPYSGLYFSVSELPLEGFENVKKNIRIIFFPSYLEF